MFQIARKHELTLINITKCPLCLLILIYWWQNVQRPSKRNKSERKWLIYNQNVWLCAIEQKGLFWIIVITTFCVEKAAGIGFEGHFITFHDYPWIYELDEHKSRRRKHFAILILKRPAFIALAGFTSWRLFRMHLIARSACISVIQTNLF